MSQNCLVNNFNLRRGHARHARRKSWRAGEKTMKQTIKIKGMHCRSCEILIEEKLAEIPEIKHTKVSYRSKTAEIISVKPVDESKIRKKIEEAGYEIGEEGSKQILTSNPQVYRDLAFSFVILIVIYFLGKQFGLFNISTGSAANPASLWVVLLIGLTAGISSCMALVGGLILGISARHADAHPEATSAQKFRPHLYFNLGRIATYFVLGGVIGLLGKAFQLSAGALGGLIIIVGIVMLIVGLQLTEISPRLQGFSISMPSFISKFFKLRKHHEKEYSHKNSALVGALTFFLPCGFTQAMMLYAMTTGNFWSGAIIMGIFALGTAPGLLGIGGFTSIIKGVFARRFFKFAGLVVIALAIFNISNGFNLAGLSGGFSQANQNAQVQAKSDPNVVLENGIQVVRMKQLSNGYSPKEFIIKKDLPVKWIIDSVDPGSCASSISAPKIGVNRILKAGENIFEFTPKETGTIKFTCSMGMYRGVFNVVENDSQNVDPTSIKGATTESNNNNSLIQQKLGDDVQVIKTIYTLDNDINPKEFKVKVGKPVRMEIYAKDNGGGCMGSMALPGLSEDFYYLEKGKTIAFDFTPKEKGEYDITCGMGVPRGTIIVE